MRRTLRPRDAGAPAALQEWIKTRPPQVQALAREFPMGIVITDSDDNDWYVMGYTEDDQLIIVPFWPWPGEDRYQRAIEQRQYAHAAQMRDGSVPVKREKGVDDDGRSSF